VHFQSFFDKSSALEQSMPVATNFTLSNDDLADEKLLVVTLTYPMSLSHL
jgi:hypothetical protein